MMACGAGLFLNGCDNGSTAQRHDTSASPSSAPAQIAVGPIPGAGGPEARIRNPHEQNPTILREGRRLFVTFNCSGCHGGRAGGGMGPSLRDETWLYGESDAQIFDSIASGRANGMPAWGTRLPEPEIWKMVSYIRSLRTDQEPDAP